jgi:ribose 1,5-bisphosphokinase
VTRPATAAEEHDSLEDAAFDSAVADGVFAFWWQAHGLKYGIPQTVDDDIRGGRTVVCNASRGIVAEVRARYANVDSVLVTAPAEILAARLSVRSRGTDGSLVDRVKRNDNFVDFRADHVIENAGAVCASVQQLLNIIQAQ